LSDIRALPAGQPPIFLCASGDLVERGRAVSFDVQVPQGLARGFALRFDRRVVAYLNRCAHVPAEMDWQPDEFMDSERRWIICSIHGALYEPTTGRCVAGPCPGRLLTRIETQELAGRVYWYPSRDIGPPPES